MQDIWGLIFAVSLLFCQRQFKGTCRLPTANEKHDMYTMQLIKDVSGEVLVLQVTTVQMLFRYQSAAVHGQ